MGRYKKDATTTSMKDQGNALIVARVAYRSLSRVQILRFAGRLVSNTAGGVTFEGTSGVCLSCADPDADMTEAVEVQDFLMRCAIDWMASFHIFLITRVSVGHCQLSSHNPVIEKDLLPPQKRLLPFLPTNTYTYI